MTKRELILTLRLCLCLNNETNSLFSTKGVSLNTARAHSQSNLIVSNTSNWAYWTKDSNSGLKTLTCTRRPESPLATASKYLLWEPSRWATSRCRSGCPMLWGITLPPGGSCTTRTESGSVSDKRFRFRSRATYRTTNLEKCCTRPRKFRVN